MKQGGRDVIISSKNGENDLLKDFEHSEISQKLQSRNFLYCNAILIVIRITIRMLYRILAHSGETLASIKFGEAPTLCKF